MFELWTWFAVLMNFLPVGQSIFDILPRTNIWVTWANITGITDFCLSLQQADNPFRTCLIGIPLQENETNFDGFWNVKTVDLTSNQNGTCMSPNGQYVWPSMRNAAWQKTVIENLNQPHHLPLQELDLLASVVPVEYVNVTATGMADCTHLSSPLQPVNDTGVIWFGDPWQLWLTCQGERGFYAGFQNLTGSPIWGELKTGGFHIEVSRGYQLPPGVFLICGDRAWPGIPLYPVGGPCYLGRSTLFAPLMKDLLKMTPQFHRSRRDLRTFDETCNDRVNQRSVTTNALASIFMPGTMTALNAKNIRKLVFWGEKQFNLTSQILSSLLLDVDSVRHATLQNRAAIILLLLAHGHGCEDFEGMCCMNLSDHSISIHKKLSQLQGNMKHILADDNPFDEWLRGLGITGWLKMLLMEGICFVIVIVVMFLAVYFLV
ncbi:uncharacterized protein LOC130142093 [Falco biarmicus]|uniref:uncharacterized protein LOC130142093 n=1 Tax=Falco biarmicus TaxID=345155 RepID=UPI0024BCF729|nr:uncharacterized protein LOC130142093 [Falco biarmicus]